jgi:hypothetical protein
MALSGPAISTLFGNKYTSAPLFLTLLAITYIYTAFGSLSVGNFINGQGKTSFNLKLSVLTAAIGFPLSIALTSQFGVTGILLTALVAGLPSLIISLQWIKKNYNLTIDLVSSVKILFSSAFAGVAAYMLQASLGFNSLVDLIVGVATFSIVFLPSILLTRTINKTDIENLRQMTTSLGPVSRLLNPALNLIEKLLMLINKSTKEPSRFLSPKESSR